MGGHRGYGPTHSQTLEKHFLGVPGLRVLAPSTLLDPGALLRSAIADPSPVLFVENKLQYQRRLQDSAFRPLEVEVVAQNGYPSLARVTVRGAPRPEVTIVGYGDMADRAAEALVRLALEEETFAELLVLEQIDPLASLGSIPEALVGAVSATRRLITVEEGTRSHGWGAEVAARIVQAIHGPIMVHRVGAADSPIPASKELESQVLPGVVAVSSAVSRILAGPNG